MNQFCIDVFMKEVDQDIYDRRRYHHELETDQKSDTDRSIVEKFCGPESSNGVVVVMKTIGYTADYVLIFDEVGRFADSLRWDNDLEKWIQLLVIPNGPHAPDSMWIQIARTYEFLWTRDQEVRDRISQLFGNWG